MTYYSQIGQDAYYIENIIKHKKHGKFLDVGANDGITESNTYALEKHYEWSGVCVEANEELCKMCRINRPSSAVYCSVVWSCEEEVVFSCPKNGNNLLSRIDNIVWNKEYFASEFIDATASKRQATTINKILGDDENYFDYFSLDVEGAELDVLKGINWSNTSFGFITVEYGNREHYQNLICYFLNNVGYKIHRINKWDIEFTPK